MFVVVFLVSGSFCFAQIAPPTFSYVTINPSDGRVTVYWEPSSTSTVVGYIIEEELNQGENFRIDTVYLNSPPYSHTFTYPKVLTQPVPFSVVALNVDGEESIRTKPSHITVHTSAKYDTCNAKINLTWTPYVGWGNMLLKYAVFQIEPNLVITKIGEVGPEVKQYTVPNIEENKDYNFYISAIRNDGGASSLSNKVPIKTTAPLPPNFMTGDYTKYSGSNKVDIHFSVDPSSVRDKYRLYRDESNTANSVLLGELIKTANGTISFSDDLPASKVYNYKLTYVNRCNIEGESSIPINNILLNGRSENMTNTLKWNSFSSWAEGTKEVNIYRSTSSAGMELLSTLSPNSNEYSDVILPEAQLTGDICYQVKAVSGNGDKISESNIFCVDMLGAVFVPNAFTPNNDGLNDVFKPGFSIIPSKYTFSIYNRYGSKVFETNNPSEGWDGKMSGGKKALDGAYIYYLRIETNAGKVLEKRGNFTVIYP